MLFFVFIENLINVKIDNKDFWKVIKKIRYLKNEFFYVIVVCFSKKEFDEIWILLRRVIEKC